MENMHNHPAYKEGMHSYRNNKDKYLNPYPKGTKEHDLFERGWSQALKKSAVSGD
jgi:hypothetical protein